MPYLKAKKESAPARTHVIEGVWQSRKIHIDNASITVEMVMERMNDFFLLEKDEAAGFAWGPDAPDKDVFALAFGCTEFTVPETWIRSLDAHTALDVFFMDQLKALQGADFILRYTDVELRRAIRRIKRGCNLGVRLMRIPPW